WIERAAVGEPLALVAHDANADALGVGHSELLDRALVDPDLRVGRAGDVGLELLVAGRHRHQAIGDVEEVGHWRTPPGARNDRAALRAEKRTDLMVRSLRSLTPRCRRRSAP